MKMHDDFPSLVAAVEFLYFEVVVKKNYLCLKFKALERVTIIEKTIKIMNQLPEKKVEVISDFAAFILKKYEESLIKENILNLS